MTNTKLLTRSELYACKKMISTKSTNSKKASALLAIHQGATYAEAAKSSGLSYGQVKYLIGRFRKLRMEAFPSETVVVKTKTTRRVTAKKAPVKKSPSTKVLKAEEEKQDSPISEKEEKVAKPVKKKKSKKGSKKKSKKSSSKKKSKKGLKKKSMKKSSKKKSKKKKK